MDDLTEEQRREYRKAFAVYDQDGNGSITVEELGKVNQWINK